MHEVVMRRYKRLQEEQKPMPSLILIDGGLGQLHAAAQALDELQIINQPMASIAKKEEILYVLGQENEPCVLDRHSPVLHLIQQIRDETHRFAVTFSPAASRRAPNPHGAAGHPRNRATDVAKAVATIWEHCKFAAGHVRRN